MAMTDKSMSLYHMVLPETARHLQFIEFQIFKESGSATGIMSLPKQPDEVY